MVVMDRNAEGENRKRKRGFQIAFIVVIFIATVLFCEWPDFHPEHVMGWSYHWYTDMLFHGGYYFVITLLLAKLLYSRPKTLVFLFSLLAISYAFELIQHWAPGRSITWLDAISNFIGISLATLLIYLKSNQTVFRNKNIQV